MITARRLTVWGIGLLGLSWFIYIHTMTTPGLIDRAGRFKGTDYIAFYVMGRWSSTAGRTRSTMPAHISRKDAAGSIRGWTCTRSIRITPPTSR